MIALAVIIPLLAYLVRGFLINMSMLAYQLSNGGAYGKKSQKQ